MRPRAPGEEPEGLELPDGRFVEGKSIPNLGEVLRDRRTSRAGMEPLERRPRQLPISTAAVRRYQGRGHRPSVGLPAARSHLAAYAWAFTLAGIRVGFDLVVFQTSRYDGYLSYANLGQPATATVEAFAQAAVAKAQSGATAPVADSVSIASAPVRSAHTRLGTVGYRAIGTVRRCC